VFPAPNPGSVTAVQATLDANIQAAGGLTASVLFSDGSIGTVSNGIANIGTSFGPSIKSGLSDVSQNLMAVLVLRLVEEGLINLTDVFGNGVLAGPPTFFPPNVTIQQLLNHQAGFKNFAANPNYKSNALSILFGDLTTNYSLINYTPILSTYVFPQGPPTVGTFLYSNTNYLAIGEKLEQLQSQGILPGSSLQDLLNQFVLAPGGITDLEFFKIGSTVAPSNASAYFFNLSGIAPEALVDQTSVLTSSGASGSIVATPQAMGQYMRALFQSQSILTSSSLSSLQSFSTISGRESNAYGLGTERFNLNIAGTNYDFVGHYGDLNYTSVYIYSSVLNAGAFVSSNNDEVSAATIIEIARQLIEAGLNPDPCANVTPTTQTVTGEICVGETFTFNGVNYTQTGTFQDTLLNVDGCDSVLLTIDLNVNPNAATSISAEICDNETFAFGGQQLSVAGTYTDTLQTAAGCDSIVTLNLTVNPTFNETVDVEICEGESFAFGGQIYTASTTVSETFQSASGCDSVVTLNLIVNPVASTAISAEICDNETFAFGGQQLSVAGTYTDTLQTAAGCDSIVTLTLSVNPTSSETVEVQICQGDSFTFGGQTYTASTTVTETFQSAAGCDSVVTLNLTVVDNIQTTVDAAICDNESFTFGGQSLTVAGTYVDTLASTAGCDSIVTLNLTVNPTFNETVDVTISAGNSVDFGGVTYDSDTIVTATFQSTAGCDSVVTLNLTVQGVVFVCTADAGSLTADMSPITLTNGLANLSATPDGNRVVPTGYSVLFVLTSGNNLVIEQTSTTPNFTVTQAGFYTIHTLIYNADPNDSNFLDLSVVIPGTTTGGDVVGIITAGDLCADLDVAGAPIVVDEPAVALAAPTNLVADDSTAFIVPLTWMDNSNNEDGFQIIRDGQIIATVGANENAYTDTVFIFGTPITYEVVAFNSTDVSDPSNQDTYEMPAQFIDLQLSFVCYDAMTDSITWEVFNGNNQRHPFIYAQWWSPQRDSLFAIPGNSRFKTKNNPQNGATFGDDNITGVWFIDERLLPGEPNSIVFSIPLSVSCGGMRQGGIAVNAPKAGKIFQGKLGRVISFGEAFWAQSLEIVPNPIVDMMTLDVKGVEEPVAVRIYDMAGKLLYAREIYLRQPVALDLEFLAQGVYTLELQTEAAFYTQKIVKE
ncbi:MAG: serine hydrolase, partial [Bacteroidota bacterium]